MKTKKSFFLILLLSFLTNSTFSQIDTAWIRTWDSQQWDQAEAITTDESNNIYVAGWSYEWNTNEDFIFAKYDPNGNLVWSRIRNYTSGDQATKILYDHQGHIYVAGFVNGSYSTTGGALCLMKYSTDGDSLWEFVDFNTSVAQVSAMEMDHDGNIILAGFDGGTMGSAVFVTIKVDPQGNELWYQTFNNNGPNESNRIYGMCIDAANNIYVTGVCDEWTYFATDIFTIKYAPNGDTLWVRQFDSPANNYDAGWKVLIDQDNNLIVGGQVGTTSPAQTDYVILKYDTAGTLLYSKYFNYPGPQSFDIFQDLLLDDSGNIYLLGNSSTNNAQNTVRMELIKFNTNGDTVWTARWGNASGYEPREMVMDAQYNIYITGFYYDSNTNTGYNGFTISYDMNGHERWENIYTDTANSEQELYALILDSNNDLIVTGRTHSSSVFDFATIKYANSTSGVPVLPEIQSELSLHCDPNPVSSISVIYFSLNNDAETYFRVLDLNGREIRRMQTGIHRAGTYSIPFDATELTSGVYFIQLVSGNQTVQRKIVVN